MKHVGNVTVKMKDVILNYLQKDDVVEAEKLKPEDKDQFYHEPVQFPDYVYRLFYEVNGKKGSVIVWPHFVEEVDQ